MMSMSLSGRYSPDDKDPNKKLLVEGSAFLGLDVVAKGNRTYGDGISNVFEYLASSVYVLLRGGDEVVEFHDFHVEPDRDVVHFRGGLDPGVLLVF